MLASDPNHERLAMGTARSLAALVLLACAACGASGALADAGPGPSDAAGRADAPDVVADATDPDAALDDTTQADTAQPDTAQLDTAQPETAQPDTAQPDTDVPDAELPDSDLPDVAGSDADATDVAAAPDAPDAATATTDGASGDSQQPKSCFVGSPPPAGAAVKPPVIASSASCPADAAWSDPKPASLEVSLGDTTAAAAFVPWSGLPWTAIIHGPQGGIHMLLSLRVRLPKDLPSGFVPGAQETFQFKAYARHGCAEASQVTVGKASLTADKSGAYVPAKPGTATMMVIFPVSSAQSGLYCGEVVEVLVRVNHKGTGAWGHSHHLVRLFDT